MDSVDKIVKDIKEQRKLYVVRFYDGFDNAWMDVSEELILEEATKLLNERTNNGTEMTSYDDIDYYKIFPANTTMLRRY